MVQQENLESAGNGLYCSLLDEPLFHYRAIQGGERYEVTLPELFVAMAQNAVRDFPALRPHQRHPWHAFLVQLAAIVLHRAGRSEVFTTANEWRAALLALTPDDPDGAAWCLVSPLSRPAFMQPPAPGGKIDDWKNSLTAADELDMLVTSKNHDLKASRMLHCTAEDWCYALISLQTQEGFLGAGNYGISRMNGGFASRCGVGISPGAAWGVRWLRDVRALQNDRDSVVSTFDLNDAQGHALIWLLPWDGLDSVVFTALDPWYIEICRRIRLINVRGLQARTTGSKVPRIAAKDLNGATGDPWMPVATNDAKALTITQRGFDYELASELLLGNKYKKPAAQVLLSADPGEGLQLVAQGLTRGKGKTEGYHERCIPISKRIRQAFVSRHTDELAHLANERIAAIGDVRKMIWSALTVLFGNGAKDEAGKDKEASDAVKDRANVFAQAFEVECDAQFFPELIEEIEADDRHRVREIWLLILAERAERVLRTAFVAGPRSGQLRYRAQSAALSRLHGAMRGNKLPALAQALKNRKPSQTEEAHEHA